uniref:Retrovirus-related Pol polyprotein from transposon TNT 1-94 n=1 Tax=Tanacetum cinerariifolium TaxID=118510 RepID=A0A699JW24_TANCI|nr:retrovirus-related Pol polyprotein from transposon TNT 1-94 [Tanacetum cinerariifolium]
MVTENAQLKMTILSTSFLHLYKTKGSHHHPLEQVIGNPSLSVRTRCQLESDDEMCMFALTVSRTELKNIKEAMADSAWIESMQEERHQFDRLDVCELVDRPLCKNVINMKWLWKNKRDEENTVIRNKSRLVDKGYAQKEGVNFEESFAPVTRLEEEVYVNQPLYGLKQAPRAWYNKLSNFLVSKEGVILSTSVSRPQLKRNQMGDRVMLKNSQGKKQQVEDHHRNVKFSNNKTSVTACNDSLNAKTSNVNCVCVICGKCVLNDNHDKCVLHYLNGVISRTKMPISVPISTREPKRIVNQSVATPLSRTVALESTNQRPRHTTRKQYKSVSKTCSWWYPKFTPPGYKWKPKSQIGNVNPNVSMPLGNASRTANILEPMTPRCSTVSKTTLYSNSFAARRDNPIHRSVKFGNDQIAPILGYGDLVQGTVTIKRVYYVEGLNHNLFSVGQFSNADLEVAFRKSTCYIRYLKGNDLLTCSRGIDLYSITL